MYKIRQPQGHKDLVLCSRRVFIVLGFTCKCVTHFELEMKVLGFFLVRVSVLWPVATSRPSDPRPGGVWSQLFASPHRVGHGDFTASLGRVGRLRVVLFFQLHLRLARS